MMTVLFVDRVELPAGLSGRGRRGWRDGAAGRRQCGWQGWPCSNVAADPAARRTPADDR